MSMPVQEASPTPSKDFFISYHREDSLAAEWTASRLMEAGFTTALQAWDAPPGESSVLEMQKAAKSAWRTVILLSPSLLASVSPAEWTEFARDSAGRGNKVLLVKVRPCQIEGMLGRTIDVAGLDNAAAGKALLNGIRDRIQPPADDGATASVKVRITRFDTDITMTEGGAIVLAIDVAAAGITLFVDLQREGFVFDSDPGAKLDDDHFRFHFPAPGKFKRRLKMFAKEVKNGTVEITCHACGDSLLRDSKVVRVSEAPMPVKWFHYVVSAVRSHPVITITVALLLAAGWGANWFSGAKGEERRAMVLRAWVFKPADYFPSDQKRQEWNDSFDNKEWTDASWHSRLTEWRPPLVIKNGGFAVTKRDHEDASFYDFDAFFMLTLVEGTASWAFRVRPQDAPSNIMQSRGYRFTLSENAGSIRLRGFRCEHLGDIANCVPLWSASSGDFTTRCKPNSTFQISARAKDLTFKFAPIIDHYGEQPSRDRGKPGCLPEGMGTFTFRDNSNWPKPFSPFGGVAFLDAQVIQRVQVLKLGELSGTTPSLDK